MAIIQHPSNGLNTMHERVLFVSLGQSHTHGNHIVQNFDALPLAGPVMKTHLLALNSELLDQTNPDLVICALFAPDCAEGGADVVALIERLQRLGYTGRIVVLGPNIPRPDLVQEELRVLGPGARLTLVIAAS